MKPMSRKQTPYNINMLNVFVPLPVYATAPPTVRYVTTVVCLETLGCFGQDIYTLEMKQV